MKVVQHVVGQLCQCKVASEAHGLFVIAAATGMQPPTALRTTDIFLAFPYILFAIVIVQCIRGGKKASAMVWDDARPNGLEWTLSSPPPYHSFTTAPEVK